MMFLFAMLAVAVLGVAAVAATGGLDRMQPVVRDHVEPAHDPDVDPARPGTLTRARFSIRLRGYDMQEVDDLIAKMASQSPSSAEVASRVTGTSTASDEEPESTTAAKDSPGEPEKVRHQKKARPEKSDSAQVDV